MKKILILISLITAFPWIINAQGIAYYRYGTGVALLKSLTVHNGKLSFISDTGGCTEKKSFRLIAENVSSPTEEIPHYKLTVERVVPDHCKGFFADGVRIEFDLEKDSGLKGAYTVSITNPVIP